MRQTHILVVDNSRLATKIIAEHLARAGHTVTIKNDLVEALSWLRKPGNLPDLVISDEGMSKMNNHELLRQVRADPAAIHPPVILLAAKDDITEKIASFEAGADDYMVKPVSAIELGLRVRALLTRTQAWQPAVVTTQI